MLLVSAMALIKMGDVVLPCGIEREHLFCVIIMNYKCIVF